MEFQHVVARRAMVRAFRDEPVAPEAVDRILSNALRGPSAGFSQGQAFIVLDTADLPAFWRTAGIADQPVTHTVRTVIIPLAHRDAYLDRYAEPDKGFTDRSEDDWLVPFWYVDTGMAVLLALQTVVDEGLGALYFGLRPEHTAAVRAHLGVPGSHEIIGAMAIGHPVDTPAPAPARPRRPRADLIHRGRW